VIKGYSGGIQRQLDLAAALVHEPEVLFLDEPTTGLDPASRLTIWEELRRINRNGTTVFLIPPGFLVVLALGAVMLVLNVRMIARYD
jgi:ABC-type multidrug transport system ATPase subunit